MAKSVSSMTERRSSAPVGWMLALAGVSLLAVGLGLVDRWVGEQAHRYQVLDDRIDDIDQRLVGARYLTPGPLRLAEELAIRRTLTALEVEYAALAPAFSRPQSELDTEAIPARVQAFAAIVRTEVLQARVQARAIHAWLFATICVSGILHLIGWLAILRRKPPVQGADQIGVAVPLPEPVPSRAPAEVPAASPRPGRAYSTASGVLSPIGRLHGRVLLVEDNPINQRVTVRQLGELGLDVELVASAEAGVEQLRRSTFAAVLMDLQLPGVDGLTATRAWRGEEATRGLRRVPVIALTANALGMDRDACNAAGMDGYLAKPARLHDLYRVLAKVITVGSPASRVENPPVPALRDDAPLHDSGMWYKLRSETGASDPRMLEELLAELRRQAPDQLAAIEAAAEAGDCERIRAVAHRLKGSAGMLGLPRLAAAAKAVELPAKGGDLAASAAQIPELRRIMVATFNDPAVMALG
jgi:CheY-like chemotaxis protein